MIGELLFIVSISSGVLIQDISLSIFNGENFTSPTLMIIFPSFTNDSPVSRFENCHSEVQCDQIYFSVNLTSNIHDALISSYFLGTTNVERVVFSQGIVPFVAVSGVRRE